MTNAVALLIVALISVESAGRNHVPGDDYRALGCLQISEWVIQDVNQATGSNYVHTDALERGKAIRICRAYLKHYASKERLGRQPTLEDMARIWNGGPNGHLKPSTDAHWVKVQKALKAAQAKYIRIQQVNTALVATL